MKFAADARYAVLLVLLAAVMWSTRLRGSIDLRWDAGVYYVLGTSLAEGKGYRLLNEPGEISAIQYPPLLSALVAVHQRALGTRDPEIVGQYLRYTYFAIFTVYVVAAYAAARRYMGATDSFLVAVISALPLHVYFLSDMLFAEVPFAMVTVLFVVSNSGGAGGRRDLGSGLLGAMAYLLRTAGVALLAAWVAEALLQGRWRRAVLRGALALLPVVAWQIHIGRVKSSEEYRHPAYAYQRASYHYYNVGYLENLLLVDPFAPERGRATTRALVDRVLGNLASMPEVFGRALLTGKTLKEAPPEWAWIKYPFMALGFAIISGMAILASRGCYLVILYVFAYISLICITPWPEQFGRYMSPLAPFLALSLVQFVRTVADRAARAGGFRKRWAAVAGCLLIAALIGKQVHGAVRTERQRLRNVPVIGKDKGRATYHLYFHDRGWSDFDLALRWLKGHARGDGVVVSVAPHDVYLKTGLKAVMVPMEIDPLEAQRLLDTVPAKFFVVGGIDVGSMGARYAAPVLEANPGRWESIYKTPKGAVEIYRRRWVRDVPESDAEDVVLVCGAKSPCFLAFCKMAACSGTAPAGPMAGRSHAQKPLPPDGPVCPGPPTGPPLRAPARATRPPARRR